MRKDEAARQEADREDRQSRRDQRELEKYAEWRAAWDKMLAEEKEVD